jgi:hypothetical protein
MRNALLAVAMARHGAPGGETVLEGEAGFYHADAGQNTARMHGEAGRRMAWAIALFLARLAGFFCWPVFYGSGLTKMFKLLPSFDCCGQPSRL